jgi:hypothetical protein
MIETQIQSSPPVFREILSKSQGDITSVFNASTDKHPMSSRFSDLKKQLWKDSLFHSWRGVLQALKTKTDQVLDQGSGVCNWVCCC